MKHRHKLVAALLVLSSASLAVTAAEKENPGRPFQEVSQKLDENSAVIQEIAGDVKQSSQTVGDNNAKIQAVAEDIKQAAETVGENNTVIQAVAEDVKQATVNVRENNLAIQNIPDLTLAALSEGATHWVSPYWSEFFSDNQLANTSISILNLGLLQVVATVTFYDEAGVALVVHELEIDPRHTERIRFPGASAFGGWVEVAASNKVLVEGGLTTISRRQEETVGVRTRTMTWYRVGGQEPPN